MTEHTDVAVVGAGFAGLAAARRLRSAGHETIVLEGRDRVGGRSWTTEVAGIPLDLGATFVGPTQDAVMALAEELGCVTEPTFCAGRNVIYWGGRLRSYSGTIPRLSLRELFNLARVRRKLARASADIEVEAPWTAAHAGELDAMSLQDWLRSAGASASTLALLGIASRVTWGAEPDAVSALHALRYVKAAGGLDTMLDVTGGAQQDRFLAGTQQIAVKMADELGDRVRLGAAVHRIEHSDAGVTVSGNGFAVQADAVIVAIPPQHRGAIDFSPALPDPYPRLTTEWPQGRLSKAYAVYDRPFWRADGCSGEALSDTPPVFITFDVSPSPDGPGVLLGFIDPREFDALDADARRASALQGFARLFGEQALSPRDYLDHRWSAEEFAPGGPTAAVGPGSWSTLGPWLHKPVGPIFWAGTETADKWTGFLDGAVRSGYRAANQTAIFRS